MSLGLNGLAYCCRKLSLIKQIMNSITIRNGSRYVKPVKRRSKLSPEARVKPVQLTPKTKDLPTG